MATASHQPHIKALVREQLEALHDHRRNPYPYAIIDIRPPAERNAQRRMEQAELAQLTALVRGAMQ